MEEEEEEQGGLTGLVVVGRESPMVPTLLYCMDGWVAAAVGCEAVDAICWLPLVGTEGSLEGKI